MNRLTAPLALALAMLAATSAGAVNLVANGGFEVTDFSSLPNSPNYSDSYNTQFGRAFTNAGSNFGGQGVTGWTGLDTTGSTNLEFLYRGTPGANAVNEFGDSHAYFDTTKFTTLSPQGGNFVALDADHGGPDKMDYHGGVSQVVSGLTPGRVYTLSFYWGGSQLLNRTGPTTESLDVTFGGDSFSTGSVSVGTHEFSGWQSVSHNFTATMAQQGLSFMAQGTPSGQPPIAVLDGVSLTAVPEPAGWTLMIAGFGGLGLALRRRRSVIAA